jgi:hypothetical protein
VLDTLAADSVSLCTLLVIFVLGAGVVLCFLSVYPLAVTSWSCAGRGRMLLVVGPHSAHKWGWCLQGAALGAQEDVVNSLHIFIAIQAHKGLAAYALGSSIVESDADISKVATSGIGSPPVEKCQNFL